MVAPFNYHTGQNAPIPSPGAPFQLTQQRVGNTEAIT